MVSVEYDAGRQWTKPAYINTHRFIGNLQGYYPLFRYISSAFASKTTFRIKACINLEYVFLLHRQTQLSHQFAC